jgi:membrane protease YdiL (CAAX protease family)
MFENFGMPALYWPPVIVMVIFAVWSWWRWQGRPRDMPGVCIGMTVESVAFALVLWGFGHIHDPLLGQLGLSFPPPNAVPSRVANAISYLGAGIYEEVIFRLILYSFLLWAIRLSQISKNYSAPIAMVLSALAFSLAHHLGPSGEPMQTKVFIFRALAGLYFSLLYHLRGFGIAVGTHACYDLIVGTMAG